MLESLQMLGNGFLNLLTFENLIAVLIGSVLGIIVGALPGVGCTSGCSLLLPLTFHFNPVTAIALLGTVYFGCMFGGAYSAILLNIPGDTPAIMTALDGYPMAMKGNAGKALMTANIASFLGGAVGLIILIFFAPFLARFGLNFGPAEMTGLLLIAMTSIGWLVGESPLKGIVATCLGILVATVGVDPITGFPRFFFGSTYLMGGIPFVPTIIGLAGFSKLIALMTNEDDQIVETQKLTLRDSIPTIHDLKRILPPALRGGLLGTFVGIMPGCGATSAAFISYSLQKKVFKNEVPPGEGSIEGLSSCEAANNAASAGSFAPLLGLGIPGSGTGAVLLGGLMLWGLNPGPLLFTNNAEFAWSCIASLCVADLVGVIVGFLILPYLVKILSLPTSILIPSVTVVCFVGAYSTTRSMYGIFIMVVMGVIGYFFDKYKYPTAPFLLAIVLSPLLETYARRALTVSLGKFSVFFGSPISIVFFVVFFVLILTPTVRGVVGTVKRQNKNHK